MIHLLLFVFFRFVNKCKQASSNGTLWNGCRDLRFKSVTGLIHKILISVPAVCIYSRDRWWLSGNSAELRFVVDVNLVRQWVKILGIIRQAILNNLIRNSYFVYSKWIFFMTDGKKEWWLDTSVCWVWIKTGFLCRYICYLGGFFNAMTRKEKQDGITSRKNYI